MCTDFMRAGASATRSAAASCAVLALFCSFGSASVLAALEKPLIYVAQDVDDAGAFGTGKLSVLGDDPKQPLRDIDRFINSPRMGADSAGNIYVTSFHSGTLTRYPAGGGAGMVLRRGLVGPADVVVNRAGGMYISEHGKGVVSYFPPDNGEPVVVATLLAGRLALDSDDNLYLTSAQEHGVFKYVAGSSALLPLVVGVSYPEGLAVDRDKNVYFSLADTSDGRGAGIYQYLPGQEQPKRVVRGGEAFGLATDAAGALYFTWGSSLYKRQVGDAGVTFVPLAQNLSYATDLVITQARALPSAQLRIISPDPQSSDIPSRPTIQGTGAPGAAVTVSISSVQSHGPISAGSYLCNTQVNDYGNWACQSTVELVPGETFGILASAWALDGKASEARTSMVIAH